MRPPLEIWNGLTVNLGQAILGVISPNVRAISLSFEDEKWMVRFMLEHFDDLDVEELEDSLTNCEAMDQTFFPDYRFEFLVGTDPIIRPEWPGRLIYRRRE